MKLKLFGVTAKEKSFNVYKSHENGDIVSYDGTEVRIIPYQDWANDRKNYVSSPFKWIECDENKTLQQTYADYVRDTEILKKETKGLINLYKSGTLSQTALALFEKKTDIIPEKITLEESLWISNSSHGAIAWAKPYEGEIWKYDICSMYPYIMQNNNVLFPVKEGEFQTLQEFGFDHSVAIYRCRIEGDSKLFRFNPKTNHYTSHDVRRARELNLHITLIKDGKPNVLFYDRKKCMTGAQIFRPFVRCLFELKQKKVPKAKNIMNCLWGALMRKQVIKKVFNEDEDVVAYPGNEILEFIPYGEDQILVTFIKTSGFYKYDWARIGPFLMSKGRSIISKLMEPHILSVVRTHTDSIWSTVPLDVKTGEGLGDLKYEGYCKNAKIVNNTKISGEFKI